MDEVHVQRVNNAFHLQMKYSQANNIHNFGNLQRQHEMFVMTKDK
jgi:hypothetical protein